MKTVLFITLFTLVGGLVYLRPDNHYPDYVPNTAVDKCKLCIDLTKAVTYDIEKYNATIVDIESLVKDLCKDIGSKTVSKECDFYVDNIQKIINFIGQGWDPERICHALHLCS